MLEKICERESELFSVRNSKIAGSVGKNTDNDDSDVDILLKLIVEIDHFKTETFITKEGYSLGSRSLLRKLFNLLKKVQSVRRVTRTRTSVSCSYRGVSFDLLPMVKFGDKEYIPDKEPGGKWKDSHRLEEKNKIDAYQNRKPHSVLRILKYLNVLHSWNIEGFLWENLLFSILADHDYDTYEKKELVHVCLIRLQKELEQPSLRNPYDGDEEFLFSIPKKMKNRILEVLITKSTLKIVERGVKKLKKERQLHL